MNSKLSLRFTRNLWCALSHLIGYTIVFSTEHQARGNKRRENATRARLEKKRCSVLRKMSRKKAVTLFSPWKQERNRKPSEDEVGELIKISSLSWSLDVTLLHWRQSSKINSIRLHFPCIFQERLWKSLTKDKTEKIKCKLNITEIV